MFLFKSAALGALLVLSLPAFSVSASLPACKIDFTQNNHIDFYDRSQRAFSNGAVGSFRVTAGTSDVDVTVIPSFSDATNYLVYYTDYVWMINREDLRDFDVPYNLGRVTANTSKEFKVYPVMLKENLPAGQVTSSISVQVDCAAIAGTETAPPNTKPALPPRRPEPRF